MSSQRIFRDYARYYNLLYKDKAYDSEVEFVLSRLRDCSCIPEALLDLGCGTGRHALEMSRRGVSVVGVDSSQIMVDIGMASLLDADACVRGCTERLPHLLRGDARSVRLNCIFDAVTSLFHVMSYQNTEEDALAVFETAKAHLRPGGVFLFDFWYGPAVLCDQPTERCKVIQSGQVTVHRFARPVHRVNDNVVEVHYDIELEDSGTGENAKLQEEHFMRYWFLPELRYLARSVGFNVVAEGTWMAARDPGADTWNAWMALKK